MASSFTKNLTTMKLDAMTVLHSTQFRTLITWVAYNDGHRMALMRLHQKKTNKAQKSNRPNKCKESKLLSFT